VTPSGANRVPSSRVVRPIQPGNSGVYGRGDRFARPDTLARIVATLGSRPDVDLLFGGTVLALPSGRRIYRPPHPATRLRHGLPAYHQATVIRRTPHLMAPYDLALPISAEYGTVATLISRGATSARLDQPIAIRACHEDSLSERATLRRFADFVTVQRQVLALPSLAVAAHVARLATIHLAYRMARSVPTRLPQKDSSSAISTS